MPSRFTSATPFAQRPVVYSDKYHIISGPEKNDLFNALNRVVERVKVGFVTNMGEGLLKTRAQIMVRITSLEHAGGRNDHWHFKAIADMPSGEERRIEGYYVPFTQNGHFSVK